MNEPQRSPDAFDNLDNFRLKPGGVVMAMPVIDYIADDVAGNLIASGERVAVQDTSEQLPLRLGLPTVRRRLDTGDYSLIDYESIISVERKSAPDLIRCCTRDRGRFDRCVERLVQFDYPLVIVESDWSGIISECKFGRVSAAFVERSVIQWMTRGLPFIFRNNRPAAADTVKRFMERSARQHDRMSAVQQEGAG